MKCETCGKEIEWIEKWLGFKPDINLLKELKKDDKFRYCSIDCRKEKRLSHEGQRNIPIKIQDPNRNKKNYAYHSKKLKKLHKKHGHLVNVPSEK